MLAATDYPLLQVFLSMLYFFLFVIWIWIAVMVVVDIFRSHDLGGWGKAFWFLFVIVIPYLGVFVYLIARGGKMHERQIADATAQQKAFDRVRPADRRSRRRGRPAREARRAAGPGRDLR